MTPRIVFLNSVRQFEQEVPPPTVVRLNLTERRHGKDVGSGIIIPVLEVNIDLQGVNDRDEAVCLHWMRELELSPGGDSFWGKADKEFYSRLLERKATIKAYLQGVGYEVRDGSYGLPRDIQPITGEFECVRWE